MDELDMEPPDKINILLKEYDATRSELVLYVNRYWQVVGASALLIFAGLSFKVEKKIIILLLPYMIFLSGYILIAMRFAMTVLGSRLREIEISIDSLSGEINLLNWQRRWSDKVLWTYIVKGKFKNTKNIWLPNPSMVGILLFVFIVTIITGYCIIESLEIIKNLLGRLLFCSVTILLYFFGFVQGFLYFRFESAMKSEHLELDSWEIQDDDRTKPNESSFDS